jgi:hypothetical protein
MAETQVEIPVAGKQDTTQRLATFQTSDFHFNLAPEKWQCRSDTGKIADTMTTSSEELNTGSVDTPHLQQELRGSSQARLESGYPTTRNKKFHAGSFAVYQDFWIMGKKFYSCEMWCSHSGTDEVRGLLAG